MKNLITRKIIFIFVFYFAFLSISASAQEPAGMKMKATKVLSSGYQGDINIYTDEKGQVYIPLNDVSTGRLLKHFSCQATFLIPMDTVVFGFPRGDDFRIKLGETTADFGKESVKLKYPALLVGDNPFIPVEALEKALGVKGNFSDTGRFYYLNPMIKSVAVEDVKGKLKLQIDSSAPVKYETSILQNPRRFAIDIGSAVLSDDFENKTYQHSSVGRLQISQESSNPGYVRILIPMDKGVEVEMDSEQTDNRQICAWLCLPQVLAPVQDLKQEFVSKFDVKSEENRVSFTIKTTGPVQYEWRRLMPPDNRYFVDIPNALYTGPVQEQSFDVGYLKSVKLYQYRGLPEPVVRVALDMNVPCVVNVRPHPKYPQEIQIEVLSQTVNLKEAAQRQGYGVTQYAGRGIVICIDPGHGGGDPGACNSSMGLQEKNLTLDISMRLASLLRKSGWNVVMTRTVDRDVSYAGSSDLRELGDRVNVANSFNAQIFVSVHINASVNSSASGTSVHYCKDDSYDLARNLHDNLVRANGRPSIGVCLDSFYVINHTNMPAVLVECAFISNPGEAALLSDPSFRQNCAIGIYNGLISYAKSKNIAGRGEAIDPVADSYLKQIKKKESEIEKRILSETPQGISGYSER